MEPGLSSMASLGLHLATRTDPAARGRAIRDVDGLVEMLGRGALTTDDTVRIAGWTTTVGRHLVAACLPPRFRATAEAPWDAARGARELARIVRELHIEVAGRCVEALEALGTHLAARSGLSLAIDDFLPPAEARAVVEAAECDSARVLADYFDGSITDGERHNKEVSAWLDASALAQRFARSGAPARDPLAAYAAAQPEPVPPEVLRSMRGAIQVSPVRDLVTHMTGTLGAGLGVHEYFVRAAEARFVTLTTAERHRQASELLADLDAAIGDIEIVAIDCGTTRGARVYATAFDDAGSLAAQIAGSVAAEDVRDRTGAVLAPAGTPLTLALTQRIEAARIASVVVRDVRTCAAIGGVCARCFGLSPEEALWTSVGDPVGARAAAVIAAAVSHQPLHGSYFIC